jgi:hypothetical protein
MKKSMDGKTASITMRVTEDLRKRVETLRMEKYPELPFNLLLAQLVGWGVDVEEKRMARDREVDTDDIAKPARIAMDTQSAS